MSDKQYQAISFEEKDHIGIITMNQPERRNALSPEMRQDFAELIPTLQYDTGLGAIILKGAEGVFCAGGDLKALAAGLDNRNTLDDRQRFYRYHDWFQKLLTLQIVAVLQKLQPKLWLLVHQYSLICVQKFGQQPK